jgi:hypothetical protein
MLFNELPLADNDSFAEVTNVKGEKRDIIKIFVGAQRIPSMFYAVSFHSVRHNSF